MTRGSVYTIFCRRCGGKLHWRRRVVSVDFLNDARARILELEGALERIAAPVRPDGTYNLSRRACEQIARRALGLAESHRRT